ncbi:RYP2-like protein [Metarhizium album ARSEF 1941]|uniref:RYP2-like protein n=1 Tax=Metarhizium album (strain ARSEF 1941) TaxID=1081103 RepID=A0A0B2WNV1_METAS|nr:RYP2-like protein [Metarhizium album ARSEF 1941]KHN95167.1 RYP2-like protein [Metarhizium album ARSEF 1941]
MAQGQHDVTNHAQATSNRQPQPSPGLPSEKTGSSNRLFAQSYGPPITASSISGPGRDVGLTSSQSSAEAFLPVHPSPSNLNSRSYPTSTRNPEVDFFPPPYQKCPQPSGYSSELPFDTSIPQQPVVKPTQKHPSYQKEPQAQLPTQSRRSFRGSDMSDIPNLLGQDRMDALTGIMFSLSMRQQPQAARACGFGDRDRRVIDPPPIVQLYIEGPSLSRDEARLYLRYESYVMNCSICDESGTQDASFMPEEYQHQRRLMGSLVGTPFVGQDDRGEEGCFFCFSDLSCRTPGAFRLKFTLIMIDPARAGVIRHFPVLTEIVSDVFHVYSAKEFPGMLPSSSLAKRLKEQGCIISIKKGNDRSKNARGPDELSEEEAGEGSQREQKRRTVGD